MAPTDVGAVFVDTNVLIYSTFLSSPLCRTARARLRAFEREGKEMWISRQVLREYLASTTRPGAIVPPPSKETVINAVGDFEPRFEIADDDAGVTALLLELLESSGAQGKQVHDANIAATMCRYGVRHLLTNNSADFVRYEPRIAVLPLCL